jgi:hypothetical protein
VVVEISDIYIVLRPKKLVEVTFSSFNSKWDANKENEKVQTSKQQKLEMYDLIKAEEKKETQENQGESLLKKLTNTIINNIQVTVNNVHIRYEDVSVPNVSYFFIITHRIQLLLGSLWKLSSLDLATKILKKLLSLEITKELFTKFWK